MQTRDRIKTEYFQDNIVLWKTLQDGISEQESFFLLLPRLEKDLFTSEVSFF